MYLAGLGASTSLQRTMARAQLEQEEKLLALQQAGEARSGVMTAGLLGLGVIAVGVTAFFLLRRR